MQPFILIPTYQPNTRLITLVDALLHAGMGNIIVVNDGSGEKYNAIFSQLPAGVIQLSHSRNQGKGSALKTGYEYLYNLSPLSSVITVDADGQHLPEDVKKIYLQTQQNPYFYILGVRKFDKQVPWRSRFGNTLTKKLLQGLFNLALDDTQTGLRSTPVWLQRTAIKINANHYEFELECLLMAHQNKVNITQIPIQTIYIENNRSSHFNPVLDSIRIYFVLFQRWFIGPYIKPPYNATKPTHL
jgi:glycosyltransferase involved in cell wall biosynthesis